MITKTLVQLAGFFALCTAPILAQNSTDLMVKIPFAFNAGRTEMPAGEYYIRRDVGSQALNIRREDGKAASFLLTFSADKPIGPKESEVTFRVYGGKYYLASIWNADSRSGREVPKTAAEKETERAGVPVELAVLKLVRH